jgi:transposase
MLSMIGHPSRGQTPRPAGHLSRQGPPLLRWALYEAAKCAARPAAPDHGYYTAVRGQRSAGLATLPVARKLARRCYHTLREPGEEALAPAA